MTDDPGTMKTDVVPRLGDPPIPFLDIDGVLLRRRHSGMFDGFEVAPHCLEFLEWATIRFRCRWLSARCRLGFLDGSHRALRQAGGALSDPRWQVLHLIEPALWSAEKTEAIDAASDFWWLDDDPSDHDCDWLRANGRQDRLIEMSVDRDPDALLEAGSRLLRSARMKQIGAKMVAVSATRARRCQPWACSVFPPTSADFAAIRTMAMTQGALPRLIQLWIVPR
jgi:hypothetical protein